MNFYKTSYTTMLVLIFIYFTSGMITHKKEAHIQTSVSNELEMTFPGLECDDIEAPFDGPTWNGVTVGSSTLSDLRKAVKRLSPNYTEHSDAQLGITQFIMRFPDAEAEEVPALIYGCINPDDEKVYALYVPVRHEEITLNELVAKFNTPDFVLWDVPLSSRVVVWLTEGVAASVNVDASEQFLPYGTVTLMVYFPYQALEEYMERWPYTHRAASLEDLVTRTPSLPYVDNPFDFDAIIATITALPSQTPMATPNVLTTRVITTTPTPKP
jgi:hypothetical protein